MTPEQNHETIGSLIARHKASREIIWDLREPYRELAHQLNDLGKMAINQESTIRATPEGFTSGYTDKAIPLNLLESFSEILGKLQAARDEKQRIETCLKEIGMRDYIPQEKSTS